MTKIYISISSFSHSVLNIKNLPVLGFLFLFIYTPVFILPFNIIHILAFISYFFLFKKYLNISYSILRSTELKFFLLSQILLFIYILLLCIFMSGDFLTLYSPVSILLEVIPISIFISIVFKNNNFGNYKFYDAILAIGLVQVVFVILFLLFPYLRELIMNNSANPGYIESYNSVLSYRIYGFARGYTFSMPLFQGLCVIIAMTLGTFKSKIYFIFVPFYLFSIVLNARIALVSIIIVAVVIFLFRFRIHFFKQILNLAILIFLLYLSMQVIRHQAENSIDYNYWTWLNAGIDELTNFSEGNSTGNINALTNTMWFAPDQEHLLTGTGQNVFGRDFKDSDIGYVVNLYFGGIIFSLLLYFSYFSILSRCIKNNRIENTIITSIILYLFIVNFKGNVFRPNEIINGVLVISIFSIVQRRFNILNRKNKLQRAVGHFDSVTSDCGQKNLISKLQ